MKELLQKGEADGEIELRPRKLGLQKAFSWERGRLRIGGMHPRPRKRRRRARTGMGGVTGLDIVLAGVGRNELDH